jgi:hypothetical protein
VSRAHRCQHCGRFFSHPAPDADECDNCVGLARIKAAERRRRDAQLADLDRQLRQAPTYAAWLSQRRGETP